MNIIELIIDESGETFNGIEAISIVTHPAIEAHGVMLSKEQKQMFAKETEERGVFIAPILKPNKLIYREDAAGEPYQVWFGKETIRTCAERYIMEGRQWDSTEQHENMVDGVCLVESWIVEDVDKDKSSIYNLDTNVGTWCGVFKIDNEDIRAKLKSGELQGISIEGYFAERFEAQMTPVEKEIVETIADFYKKD